MLAPFEVPIVALIFLMPIALAAIGQSKEGFWLMWALGLCFLPCWIGWQPTPGMVIYTRTAIALGGAVGLMIAPWPGARPRLRIIDALVLLHFGSMVLIDIQGGSAGLLTPIVIFFAWVCPYLVGRRFLTTTDDPRRFARMIGPMIAAVTALALLETFVIRKNPQAHLFSRFLHLQEIRGEIMRMGFRRASGNVDMPIFFGVVMNLLMPWSLVASAMPGRPWWYRWLPAINVVGAACSLSRSPVIFTLLSWAICVFFRRPRLRPLLGTAAVLGAGFVYFALDPLLEASAEFVGDNVSSRVVLNGREEAVNSTRQRALMREAYAPALGDAGLFGFGAAEVQGIPDRYKIPGVLASIESHYIYHQLGYGLAGIGLFNLIGAASVLMMARVAWRPRGGIEDLAGALAGAQVAVLLTVLTVFFSDQVLPVWLFNTGLAANLSDLRRRQQEADRSRPDAGRGPAGTPPWPA